VENTSDLEVGMVVFLGKILVITAPIVSSPRSPRDSGVTSKSTSHQLLQLEQPRARGNKNHEFSLLAEKQVKLKCDSTAKNYKAQTANFVMKSQKYSTKNKLLNYQPELQLKGQKFHQD
jgi:hypothetical protein